MKTKMTAANIAAYIIQKQYHTNSVNGKLIEDVVDECLYLDMEAKILPALCTMEVDTAFRIVESIIKEQAESAE